MTAYDVRHNSLKCYVVKFSFEHKKLEPLEGVSWEEKPLYSDDV